MLIPLMWIRSSRMAFLALVASITLLAHAAQAQQPATSGPPSNRFLFTDKECVGLLPPQHVADNVLVMQWSADSRRLLVLSSQENLFFPGDPNRGVDIALTRWDRKIHTSSPFWKRHLASSLQVRSELQWLPSTEIALMQVAWMEPGPTSPDGQAQAPPVTRQELLWIDVAHTSVKELPIEENTLLYVSPNRPLAVLVHQPFVTSGNNQPKSYAVGLNMDGSPGNPVALPDGAMLNAASWSEDGRQINMLLVTPGPDKKLKQQWVGYNPTSGSALELQKQPAAYVIPPPPASILHLKEMPQTIRNQESSASILSLWVETTLKSEMPRTMVCADADQGMLAPDGAAVAYRSQGSAWVNEFLHMPLADFKAMQARARRVVLINNAKQLGLGAIMWANDHNDTLPGPNSIEDELRPYLANTDSLFDSFNYTYAGGPLSEIESPAQTELGYVDGPDGRAIIYTDGHVKWQNKQP